MNPVIRRVSAPSAATCSALVGHEPLELHQPGDRLADHDPVLLGDLGRRAARLRRRGSLVRHRLRVAARAPVARSPPATNARARPRPARMPWDASASARPEARSDSVTRASAVTCWPICSTVLDQRTAQLGDVDRGGDLGRRAC